jgi:hypothetical protein
MVINGIPLPGRDMLITPLLTFAPVAMAVAEAAESVTPPSALRVLIEPLKGKASNDKVPLAPVAYIPDALTCSNPIPSPMNRMMFFAAPVGAGWDVRMPLTVPQEEHARASRERAIEKDDAFLYWNLPGILGHSP